MPRQFINKYLPKAKSVKEHRSLRWLGEVLHDTNLWHLNRRSVASAVFVGIFCCFMPIPLQMLLAACLAIFFHSNLPLSISLVWISNPLTMVPIGFVCYRFGLMILGMPYDSDINWTMSNMGDNFFQIVPPLVLGCVVLGLAFGSLGYVTVRILWRLHVQRTWTKRRESRAKRFGQKIKKGSSIIKEKAKQKGQSMRDKVNNRIDCDHSGLNSELGSDGANSSNGSDK